MAEPARIYTKAYYDRLKAIEGRHWWTLGMTDIMDRLLAGKLPEGPGARFLDIGCGSGIGLAWAARRLPSAERIGIDVSPLAIEHCQGLGAELHVADSAALPVESRSIDLAICIDVLQHLEDETPTLKEVARVLRPGALFFVRTNARSLTPPPPGSVLFTRSRLTSGVEAVGLTVLACSRANLIGSLAGELSLYRRYRKRKQETAVRNGTAEHDHLQGAERFHGGGYGGGLALAPEESPGLGSRIKRGLLAAEGKLIRFGVRLPFGHSLVALARLGSEAAGA